MVLGHVDHSEVLAHADFLANVIGGMLRQQGTSLTTAKGARRKPRPIAVGCFIVHVSKRQEKTSLYPTRADQEKGAVSMSLRRQRRELTHSEEFYGPVCSQAFASSEPPRKDWIK